MSSKSAKPKESAESKASPSWDMATPAPAQAAGDMGVPSLAPVDPLAMQGAGGGGNGAAQEMIKADPGRKELPPGRVNQLDIDAGSVLAEFDSRWLPTIKKTRGPQIKAMSAEDPEGVRDYPFPLEAPIRSALSGSFFVSTNYFDSGWVDDGYNDIDTLGLWDANVRAEITAYTENLKPIHAGDASYNTSATGGSSRTDGLSGGVTAGASGSGLSVGVNGSANSSDTASVGSSMGMGVVLPTVSMAGDLVFECSLSVDTLAGEYPGAPFDVRAGTAVISKVAGT